MIKPITSHAHENVNEKVVFKLLHTHSEFYREYGGIFRETVIEELQLTDLKRIFQ